VLQKCYFNPRRQQGRQPRNGTSLGGCLVTSELHDSAAQFRPVWRASCGSFVVSAEVPADEDLRTSGAQQRSTQPKRLKERKRMPGIAHASGRNRCPSRGPRSAKLGVWSRESTCGALPDSCDMSTETDSPVPSIRAMQNHRCGGRAEDRTSAGCVGRSPHWLRRLAEWRRRAAGHEELAERRAQNRVSLGGATISNLDTQNQVHARGRETNLETFNGCGMAGDAKNPP
jgi:hypothetical protein